MKVLCGNTKSNARAIFNGARIELVEWSALYPGTGRKKTRPQVRAWDQRKFNSTGSFWLVGFLGFFESIKVTLDPLVIPRRNVLSVQGFHGPLLHGLQ